jgi:hypothetical protein
MAESDIRAVRATTSAALNRVESRLPFLTGRYVGDTASSSPDSSFMTPTWIGAGRKIEVGDVASLSAGGVLSPPDTDPDPVLMLDAELSRWRGIASNPLNMQKKSLPPVTRMIAMSSRRIACDA